MDLQKPLRERRGARWLARAGAAVGCAIALGGGYAAAAGGLPSLSIFSTDLAGGQYGYLPYGLAAGADDGLWFSAVSTNANAVLGRVGEDGAITYFTAGLNAGSFPDVMLGGPDGNVWFADRGTPWSLGRITPAGTITEFPTGAGIQPDALAAGLGGNIWFTGGRGVGKMTPTGAITEYPDGPNRGPRGIALGADGAMWFTDFGPAAIGRITTDGTITEYTTGLGQASEPSVIAAGPDGNMWFLDNGAIGRITPGGQITEFALPAGSNPYGLAAGPDGNMWFTNQPPSGQLGRIAPDGTITNLDVSSYGLAYLLAIATGADGDIWLTGASSTGVPEIVRMDVGAPAASTAPPQIAGSGQEGASQSCNGATWADWAGRQPSITAFADDGYQWLLDGNAIAGQTAQSYTPTASDVGHQLACRVTATYVVLATTVSANSAPVTVFPGATTTTTSGSGGGTTTTTGTTPSQPAPAGTTTTTTPAPPAGPAPRKPVSSKTAAKVSIVSSTTVHLDTKSPKLRVTLKASKACETVLVLLAPNGKLLARWTVHLAAGTHKLALVVPAKARHTGRDRLRVQTDTAKPSTITISLRP